MGEGIASSDLFAVPGHIVPGIEKRVRIMELLPAVTRKDDILELFSAVGEIEPKWILNSTQLNICSGASIELSEIVARIEHAKQAYETVIAVIPADDIAYQC